MIINLHLPTIDTVIMMSQKTVEKKYSKDENNWQRQDSLQTVAMFSYVPSFNSSIVWCINFGSGNLYIYRRQTHYVQQHCGHTINHVSEMQTQIHHMQLLQNVASNCDCHFCTYLHCCCYNYYCDDEFLFNWPGLLNTVPC